MEQSEDNQHQAIITSCLTNISSQRAIKALNRLGFSKVRQTGAHIILKKDKISFPVPHRQELNPKTLKNILRQANITLEEFKENL